VVAIFNYRRRRWHLLNDELHLYYADSPLGPWTRHNENPIKSDARNARPAAIFFIETGFSIALHKIVPQVTEATVLNRIDRLDTDGFSETPVGRIDADWREACRCTHTLSRSENYWQLMTAFNTALGEVVYIKIINRWENKTCFVLPLQQPTMAVSIQ